MSASRSLYEPLSRRGARDPAMGLVQVYLKQLQKRLMLLAATGELGCLSPSERYKPILSGVDQEKMQVRWRFWDAIAGSVAALVPPAAREAQASLVADLIHREQYRELATFRRAVANQLPSMDEPAEAFPHHIVKTRLGSFQRTLDARADAYPDVTEPPDWRQWLVDQGYQVDAATADAASDLRGAIRAYHHYEREARQCLINARVFNVLSLAYGFYHVPEEVVASEEAHGTTGQGPPSTHNFRGVMDYPSALREMSVFPENLWEMLYPSYWVSQLTCWFTNRTDPKNFLYVFVTNLLVRWALKAHGDRQWPQRFEYLREYTGGPHLSEEEWRLVLDSQVVAMKHTYETLHKTLAERNLLPKGMGDMAQAISEQAPDGVPSHSDLCIPFSEPSSLSSGIRMTLQYYNHDVACLMAYHGAQEACTSADELKRFQSNVLAGLDVAAALFRDEVRRLRVDGGPLSFVHEMKGDAMAPTIAEGDVLIVRPLVYDQHNEVRHKDVVLLHLPDAKALSKEKRKGKAKGSVGDALGDWHDRTPNPSFLFGLPLKYHREGLTVPHPEPLRVVASDYAPAAMSPKQRREAGRIVEKIKAGKLKPHKGGWKGTVYPWNPWSRHAQPSMAEGATSVLRVVALAGEVIEFKGSADAEISSIGATSFRIPHGHCWLAADNPELSAEEALDSRTFGPVPMDWCIVGRAFYHAKATIGGSPLDHGWIGNSYHSCFEDDMLSKEVMWQLVNYYTIKEHGADKVADYLREWRENNRNGKSKDGVQK